MIWTSERFKELVRVNLKVNENLTYWTDEAQYHVAEYWANAQEIGLSEKGDCEDYCIYKMSELRTLGWAKEDLNIAVCLVNGKGHAVLIVTTDKEDYCLDNNVDNVLPWRNFHYKWVEVSVKGNFKEWVAIGA